MSYTICLLSFKTFFIVTLLANVMLTAVFFQRCIVTSPHLGQHFGCHFVFETLSSSLSALICNKYGFHCNSC
jgi:hypothetical protein